MTAYLTFAPNGTSLEGLVLAAGARRNIERCFQEGKSQLGPCRSAIIYDYSSRLVSMIAGQDHSSRRGQSHCCGVVKKLVTKLPAKTRAKVGYNRTLENKVGNFGAYGSVVKTKNQWLSDIVTIFIIQLPNLFRSHNCKEMSK